MLEHVYQCIVRYLRCFLRGFVAKPNKPLRKNKYTQNNVFIKIFSAEKTPYMMPVYTFASRFHNFV